MKAKLLTDTSITFDFISEDEYVNVCLVQGNEKIIVATLDTTELLQELNAACVRSLRFKEDNVVSFSTSDDELDGDDDQAA